MTCYHMSVEPYYGSFGKGIREGPCILVRVALVLPPCFFSFLASIPLTQRPLYAYVVTRFLCLAMLGGEAADVRRRCNGRYDTSIAVDTLGLI
jgi:hypothetical protein